MTRSHRAGSPCRTLFFHRTMLKAKQCSQILGRINSDGIETTMCVAWRHAGPIVFPPSCRSAQCSHGSRNKRSPIIFVLLPSPCVRSPSSPWPRHAASCTQMALCWPLRAIPRTHGEAETLSTCISTLLLTPRCVCALLPAPPLPHVRTPLCSLIAGIVANLYQIYANSGHNSLNAESLMCLLSDCEHGRLAVTCIGSASGSDHMLLLCTYGPADKVEFGTLKSKLMTLREALDAPLQQLNAS